MKPMSLFLLKWYLRRMKVKGCDIRENGVVSLEFLLFVKILVLTFVLDVFDSHKHAFPLTFLK